MSISKEIFGIEYKNVEEVKKEVGDDRAFWYNYALKEIDEYELSEEELAKIIGEAITLHRCKDIRVGYLTLVEFTAKYTVQNLSNIFVRKNGLNINTRGNK